MGGGFSQTERMNTQALELTELNSQILILKVVTAAAWADGSMDERERKLLVQMIERTRLSGPRKAALILGLETQPTPAETDAVLEELCQRAKSDEMKAAIFALVDKMIASDNKMDVKEVAFREKLEKTLVNKGQSFFSVLINYMSPDNWIGKKS